MSVKIAHCYDHGLHGERDTCFVCDKPVKQIPMVYLDEVSGADAMFCGDCLAPWRPYCGAQGHGPASLGELFDAFSNPASGASAGLQGPETNKENV